VFYHGDAKGIDRYIACLLELNNSMKGLEVTEIIAIPANWKKHGKEGGFIRNREMLSQAVERGVELGKLVRVLGYPTQVSKGTMDCLRAAQAMPELEPKHIEFHLSKLTS